MEQKLKKGRVKKVEEENITIFNHDGQCEDMFSILPQDSENIRKTFGPGEEIFYVTWGDELMEIALESAVPEDVRSLYEQMPRNDACVATH